jgi:predicted  nucleic acid-binding Zn-ribbon protein
MVLKQLENMNHALKKMQVALNNHVSVYENTLRDILDLKSRVTQLETTVAKLTNKGTSDD